MENLAALAPFLIAGFQAIAAKLFGRIVAHEAQECFNEPRVELDVVDPMGTAPAGAGVTV